MAVYRGRLSLQQKKSLLGYLFISPWLIGFLLFFVTPVLTTVAFSLNEIKVSSAGFTSTYIGLTNFKNALFADPKFPQYLFGSVLNIMTDVPSLIIFSLFAALLLHQKFIGNGFVKTIFFLTVILSSGVFLKMQAETMYVNSMQFGSAMSEGAGNLKFLQSIDVVKYLLDAGISPQIMSYITAPVNKIFQVILQSGIQIFIFLAGLNSISTAIYESCYMEGATGWETFWKITFPMISPLILVNIVYTVIDSFTSYTNQTLIYINSEGLSRMHIGFASAMSWIYFIVIDAILGVVVLVVSRRVFYQN